MTLGVAVLNYVYGPLEKDAEFIDFLAGKLGTSPNNVKAVLEEFAAEGKLPAGLQMKITEVLSRLQLVQREGRWYAEIAVPDHGVAGVAYYLGNLQALMALVKGNDGDS